MKHYSTEVIDRKKEAQDEWYLQRRREISEEENAVQAKLEISQPGDAHEVEADTIASNVINGGDASVHHVTSANSAQRKEEGTASTVDASFSTALSGTKGSGQSLDDSTRTEMESKMGTDLSGVQIHTGSAAHAMSESINAKAFTHGQDIYFKNGNYDTHSDSGKELLAHELVHTQQQGSGVSRMVQRNIDDVDKAAETISKNIYKGFLWLRRLFKNPSAKRGIEAYHVLASLSQEDILLFQAEYPTLYKKVMDNLPVQFLQLPTSGLVKGISGEEVTKLLDRLYLDTTWEDPIMLDVVVSLIVQAFGVTVSVDEFGTDIFGPDVKLKTQKDVTLAQYIAGKYNEHQGKVEITEVLDKYGFSATGYSPLEAKEPYSEYSMGRAAVGYFATSKGKHRGVVGSFNGFTQAIGIGRKKRPVLEDFAMNEFQDWMGGAMGGFQFSDPKSDQELKNEKTGLLNFEANYKTGEAHISATHLPFDNVNYLGADYSFKSGPGTFDVLKADLDWSSNKENDSTMGSVHVGADKIVFNNLRIIFQNETYAIGRITITGLNADLYQVFSRSELDTTYELIFKALDVLMSAGFVLMNSLKLVGNRFSAKTTPEGGNDLAALLQSGAFRGMEMDLGFDSLLIEHILLVDKDYTSAERKKNGPVADTDYFEKIELKRTDITFSDAAGKDIVDAEKKIEKIKATAKTENRDLTDAELLEIQTLSTQQDDTLKDYVLLVEKKKKLSKLKADRLEVGLGKQKAKKLDDKIKAFEAEILKLEAAAGPQNFHLKVETNDILLTNPEMINNTLSSSLNTYAGKVGVDQFGSKTVTFDTDINQEGISNSKLSFTGIDIPQLAATTLHYKTQDGSFEIAGDSAMLEGITGDVDLNFKDQDSVQRKKLFDVNEEIRKLQAELKFSDQLKLNNDEQIAVDDKKTQLENKKAERLILLETLDKEGNPLKILDIKQLTVQKLTFVPTLIKFGDKSTIVIPTGNPPVQLDVLKLDKFKLDFTTPEVLAGGATVTANKLTLPKDYQFQSTGDKSTFTATSLTDIVAETVSFTVVSLEKGKKEFNYGAGSVSGKVGLQSKEGDEIPFDLGVLLNKTKIGAGKFVQLDDFQDRVSFTLSPVSVPAFNYEGETIKVGAKGEATFTDLLVDVTLHYAPSAQNKAERGALDKVTLNEFGIDKISGKDLYIERKNSQGKWEPLVTAPDQGEPFSLNKLKVKTLGLDFSGGKFTPVITSATSITLGDQNTQAFIMAQLGLQFGQMFKTDLTDIKIASIAFQGGDADKGSKLMFKDIWLGDVAIPRLNFVSEEWKIKSSGKTAHLDDVTATIEVEFEPGKWDQIKTVKLTEMNISKLTADGLELIKDPGKKEEVTLVKLPSGETSSIDSIWIKNFTLEFSDGKFNDVDYSKTTAGTGKISIPAITSDYLKDLSSSLVVKAESMTFSGKPKGAFDISIKKPKLGMHDQTSEFSFLNKEGSKESIKIYEALESSNFFEAEELGVSMDADGLFTFKIVKPYLKNLSFGYGDMNFDAEGKVDGTLTIKEGKAEFDGTELPAWLISADNDLVFEHILLTMFKSDKSPSDYPYSFDMREVVKNPFPQLNGSNGSATVRIAGHSSEPIEISAGYLNFFDISESMGELMHTVIMEELDPFGPNALAFFDWMEDYTGILDWWAGEEVEQWQEDLFNLLDTGNGTESRDAFATWVQEIASSGIRLAGPYYPKDMINLELQPILTGNDGIPLAHAESEALRDYDVIMQKVHVREILDRFMFPPFEPGTPTPLAIDWNPDDFHTSEEFFHDLVTNTLFQTPALFGRLSSPNGDTVPRALALWMGPRLSWWFQQNMNFDLSVSGIDLEQTKGGVFKYKEQGGDVTVNVLNGSLQYMPITISDIPAFTYSRKGDDGKSMLFDVGGIKFDKTVYEDPGGNQTRIRNPKVTVKDFKLNIQKKSLEIGSVNDPLEHQADAIASQVVNGQQTDISHLAGSGIGIQTKSENDDEAPLDLLDDIDHPTGGQSMDDTTRTQMETGMGVDFGGVKIHTGDKAHGMNEQVNAKAFTYGQNVFFRNGNYNPSTPAGKELLAHELVHTVQQSGTVRRKIQRAPVYKEGPNLQSIWFKGIPELESVFDGKSTFTIGEEGEHVKRIQQTLQELQWGMKWKDDTGKDFVVKLGSSGDDGIFGEMTFDSLKGAQKKLGIDETGIVDQATMKKFDSIFWSQTRMPQSTTAIKQQEAAERERATVRGTTETAEQRYDRLLKEYKEIIERYGIQDLIRYYSLVDLGIVEHLLEDIKPKLLLDLHEETEILPGAKRYDAWYGSARLVILDAESIDKDHNHEVALNVQNKEGVLKFTTYRDLAADAAFNNWKKNNAATAATPKGGGITGELGTIVIPVESAQKQAADLAKTRQLRTNSEGHVIWNLPLLDAAHLAQEGVDASALRFVYEDRNEFVEGPASGGCRYKTYYHEAYIGVIDVQLSTYSQFHRTDDAYFTLAYTDPYSLAWKENEAKRLFRIAYGEGSQPGDRDLIAIVGRYGFQNYFGAPTTTEELFAFSFGAEGVPGVVGVENMEMIPSASSATRIGTSKAGFVSDEVVDFNKISVSNQSSTENHATEAPTVVSEPYVPQGPMKGKAIGHTFTKHGSYNTIELQLQAKNTGQPQGQWIDDAAAEKVIAENLYLTKNGAVNVAIPSGVGRIVNPNGTFTPATHARLVPSGSGVKTAYPIEIP